MDPHPVRYKSIPAYFIANIALQFEYSSFSLFPLSHILNKHPVSIEETTLFSKHTFPPNLELVSIGGDPANPLNDFYIVSLLKVDREASQRRGQRSPGPLQSRPQDSATATHSISSLPKSFLLILIVLFRGNEALLLAFGEGDGDHGEEKDEDEESGHPEHQADYKGRSICLSGDGKKDVRSLFFSS